MDDRQALNDYVRTGSQAAFGELADRYIDLVFAAARRQLGDAHQAEDATQAVFIVLAKKAKSIPHGVLLSAWLYRVTRYVCRNAIRQAARRVIHERNRATMKHEAAANTAVETQVELRSLIDQAMSSLASKDRDALLMRYFQQQSISDVSAAMGISEEAARKRIARALQRLSDYFKRKGITAPLASIDAGLLAWAVEAAPHALHQTVGASIGVASTAAASTLAKGAMFMMTLKTNITIACAAVVLLLGTTTVIVVAANRPSNAAAATGDSTKAMQLMQEGWQLWQQRKFAQAETRFSAAVKLDPKLTNAWNGLAWSQFNQGESDAAEKSWTKVVALEPNHPAAENGLGWINFNRGDQAKAEQHWLASAKTPNSSASWSGLARIYLLQSKWDEAKTYAGKLVDSGDETAKPWLEAALTQQLSDDLKAQISPPPVTSADIAKGWQMLNQNRVVDAVALFRVATSKDPKDANAFNGLGWALMRTGKSIETQTAFETAIKIDPTNGGAMNGLAIVLNQQGKTDQAIELWKKLDEMTPTATNAGTFGLARTYLEQKQYDKALPYFQRLSKDQPTDATIQQGLQECESHAAK